MTYSDDTLRRYLDGTLSQAESEAVERALAGDEALQRRTMALDTTSGMVAETFAGLPGEKRLETLRKALPEAPAAKPRWMTGAAMAASVALGAVFGGQFLAPDAVEATDWRMEVARYQALYVPETVAFLGSDPKKLESEIIRASYAVGLELDLEALSQVGDLTLRRAQVLGFEGEPLIQLAYTDPSGEPFALCIMPKPNGEEGPQMLAGLATHAWESQSHGFILVGGTQQETIDALVTDLKAGKMKSL